MKPTPTLRPCHWYFSGIFWVLLVLLGGCEKKFVDAYPVIEITDISTPEDGDLKYMSFPTPEIGYVASDAEYLYRTSDGGSTWTQMPGPGGLCKSLSFAASATGIGLFGSDVYRTSDAGTSWRPVGPGDFTEVTDNGTMAYGSCNLDGCSIYKSVDGVTFSLSHQLEWTGEDFVDSYVVGEYVYVAGTNSPNDDKFLGVDLSKNTPNQLSIRDFAEDEYPSGIYRSEDQYYICGPLGKRFDGPAYRMNMQQYAHVYNYHAIDGFGDLVVAVGEKMMTTNMQARAYDYWNPILDTNGNGFSETFYGIHFLDPETFIVIGSNGLVWRAKL